MNHTLLALFRRKKVDTVIGGILLDVLEHLLGQWILQRSLALTGIGRDNVINRSKRALRKWHRKLLLTNHRKRLRRGNLVDQMQPNEELILP